MALQLYLAKTRLEQLKKETNEKIDETIKKLMRPTNVFFLGLISLK